MNHNKAADKTKRTNKIMEFILKIEIRLIYSNFDMISSKNTSQEK